MTNDSKPNAFLRALSIPSCKISFIAMIVCTIACFFLGYVLPKWEYANYAMMMCGIISVLTCQHFSRVITAIRWEDNADGSEE